MIQAGHITCDNASNNSTMMQEVAIRLKAATGKKYEWRRRKIKWAFENLLFFVLVTYSFMQLSGTRHQLGDASAHIDL